ncbi:MAG: LpxD N-terminal domain-containing protein, partial [Parvibaculum sp.]
MADPRFFRRAGPFSLAELAPKIDAELADANQGDLMVQDVAPLDRAGAGEVSFLDNPKYIAAFTGTAAAACIIHPR